MDNPNQTAIDEYLLDDIVTDNHIYAQFFIPFVLTRLSIQPDDNKARLSIRLRDIGSSGEKQRILNLSWSDSTLLVDPLPVQSKVVTEFAACGIACVLVPLYARLSVLFTAQEGDRFDYWVGNGERQWGLEVSGTILEDVYARHRAKVRQLLKNPYSVDGYVAVTKFSTRESIFSCHLFVRWPHPDDNEAQILSGRAQGTKHCYGEGDKMTPSENGSISRQGLSARFIQDEKETSRLILEANFLKEKHRNKEAAQKFAQAARLEMKNCDELSALGLLDLYYIHRFSAASCWAQAGNLYQAILIIEELLANFELKPPLRQRIAGYLSVLETRVDQWMTSYAPDAVAVAD